MVKEKLLVSACLLGENCKYNGLNNLNDKVVQLKEKYDLISFCPEEEGGLSTPRVPSEIKGNKVYSMDGNDVTSNFSKGAIRCKELCKKLGIKKALLKDKSPSCGSKLIYDGTFSGTLIKGMGFTTSALNEINITVYNEHEIEKL